MESISIFWFRSDLRLEDNPGLYEAAQHGDVLPIYIWDEKSPPIGGASKWWLHHSLQSLNQQLNGNLTFYKGEPDKIIEELLSTHHVRGVFWNRCYDPYRIKNDAHIKQNLRNQGVTCKSFNATLLWEPWEVLKKDGLPYKVYTPYYQECLKSSAPRAPVPTPSLIQFVHNVRSPCQLDDLALIDIIPWHKHWHWTPGEYGAHNALNEFLDNGIQGYKKWRDYPDKNHTSKLSPHLHFGEISPHQIWHKLNQYTLENGTSEDVQSFRREIAWREFSHYQLYHFPNLPSKNFQQRFNNFPWKNNDTFLKAWQKGQTGYPIVDAGMRELWQTGTMHNRVRMIVASFLVKNLGVHWRQGADWFWDCLVDADLANNSASWQWVAGSGADAAPYFRIFNPVTQGEKFDPEGIYTRHFVPELKNLPQKYLFNPWEAPMSVMKEASVSLGANYPHPIVDLKTSREEALLAYRLLSTTEPLSNDIELT